jgi:hypothetical protein
VKSTDAAIERDLTDNGLVLRYRHESTDDGLPAADGAFLACSFWLVDNYVLAGRREDACSLFDRLLSLRNDLGLLADEYHARSGRMLGNFPHAFSQIALINSAHNLWEREKPAEKRSGHAPAGEGSDRKAADSHSPRPLRSRRSEAGCESRPAANDQICENSMIVFISPSRCSSASLHPSSETRRVMRPLSQSRSAVISAWTARW